jgi:peptidyl-prolyl cis-trans isomerase B (cyclophilin B)
MKNIYSSVLSVLLLSICVFALPAGVQAQEEGKPLYRIRVDRDGDSIGVITVEMFPAIAPKHVSNFDSLVSIGFYDGTAFHRVIPGFMIQGGDPNSRDQPRSTWGFGDPSQRTVPAEFSNLSHVRGMLSAARSNDPNSATSQFFICHGSPTYLDHNYTIYGRVTSGMAVVDTIVNAPRDASDNPLKKHTMTVTRIGIDTSMTPTPVLRTPQADARYVASNVALTWDSVPGAVLYYLQISRTEDFSAIDTTIATTLTRYMPGNLKLGRTSYYWRVGATNGGRDGGFSPIRKFTTSILVPRGVAPATGSTVETTSPVLSWNRVEGATSYRVQLSTRVTYTPLLLDSVGIVDTFVVLGNLVPGTKYFWRVRALEDTAAGTFSSNSTFTVAGPTSVDREIRPSLAAPELVMGAPGSGTATFIVSLEHGAELRVIITDIGGRDLRQVHAGMLGAGVHRFPLDLSELPAGTYLIRLEQEGVSAARTFQVVR